jgi:UPF0271 protein
LPLKRVLDATAFFLDIPFEGELCTTPSVVAELVDTRSRRRLEAFAASGLVITSPSEYSLQEVQRAAAATGDSPVLSLADREILAVALDIGAEVVSDDFAVQNVARHLGIPFSPLQQRRAKKRIWKFRCPGCGRLADGPGECPICGSGLKRTLK